MSNKQSRAEFLSILQQALVEGHQSTVAEIEVLVEQRDVLFGGNMRRLLRIDSALVDAYDQMVRDKRVVARRYQLFASKVASLAAADMTAAKEKMLRLEALSVVHHAQAVAEFADEMREELEKVREAMEQMRKLLESFGGEEDSDDDLLDNDGDDRSDDLYDPSHDYPF